MATKPASAAKKLTTSNTKQEMLNAYNELLGQLEEQQEAESKPEAKVEQRITAEAVAVADEITNEGVVNKVGQLRSDVGRLLAQVSEKLEEQTDRYAKISKAIAFKEKELAEIYEIQKSALSLAALIQAQQQKRDDFEAEMTAKREQLAEEIESTRAGWTDEKKRYEAELKERDAAETRRRKREEEEYRYAFAREQQLAKDQFADEKGKIERELADRKAEVEKDLAQRERAVADREAELNDLRRQVAAFPKQLDEAVARAVKETTARLQADAASREQLLQREFAGERNVSTTRIAALEQTVKEQAEHLARLSQQSERAYGQVQEIAVRAIEGSSSFKSLTNLQQMLADQARKPVQEK
jgi:hypothetical protein